MPTYKKFRWFFHPEDGTLTWWIYRRPKTVPVEPFAKGWPKLHRLKLTPGLWPVDHHCDRCGDTGFTGTRDYDGICDDCAGQSTYADEYERKWYRDHRFGRWLWIVRNGRIVDLDWRNKR